MSVAETILAQLGGSRFSVMTGSKGYVGGPDSLSFRVGSNPQRVTHCRVKLEPDDTYRMTFERWRGLEARTVAEESGVYAEDLQRLFRTHTGLETSL